MATLRGRSPAYGTALALVVPALSLAVPSIASAELSIKVDGGSGVDVTITGTSTGYNVSYDLAEVAGQDRVTIDPHGAAWTSPAPLPAPCTGASGQPIVCDASPGDITVDLRAGDNSLSIQSSSPRGYTPLVNLGDGDDDVMIANMGGAEIRTGAGSDTVRMSGPSGQGRDYVRVGNGKKQIALSNGEFDRVSFLDRTTAIEANLASGILSDGGTITGVEELAGTRYNDTLIGDGNANVLSGGPGSDIVSALGGNDELHLLEEFQEVTDPWPTLTKGDAESDSVDCSDGHDSVTGDRLDLGTTDSDCEKRMPALDGFVTVNRTTAAPGDVVTSTPPAVLNPDSTAPRTEWYRVTPGIEIPELLTASASYTVQPGDQYLIARTTLPLPTRQYRTAVVTVSSTSPQGPPQGGEGPLDDTPAGGLGSTPPPVVPPSPSIGASVPPTNSTKPRPKPKPLTTKQKLAKAIKQCKAKKSKKARKACEKRARAKFKRKTPKP